MTTSASDPANSEIIDLANQASAYANSIRRLPESTYRLQLHKDFTFRHAAEIIPYLASLGITHVYCSSYLAAVTGSMHGYDVIDPTRLNPEIGSEADYAQFIDSLNEAGLTHILDTVPNHVGIGTNDNPWWNDVLENGRNAERADYFDINWNPAGRPELAGKVLLPLLGDSYDVALNKGEIDIVFDSAGFGVRYFNHRFPIRPESYTALLNVTIQSLPPNDAEVLTRSMRQSGDFKAWLADLCNSNPAIVTAIQSVMTNYAGTDRIELLHELLEQQNYRLASWRMGPEEINYRRFFAINDLAALQMERIEVFEATNIFILPRLAEGVIAGLRIDHPDGLSDPLQYFRRLQSHFLLACARLKFQGDKNEWDAIQTPLLAELNRRIEGEKIGNWPLYVVIEKILAFGESLPASWPVDGTSGYDFLDLINGLFVDASAEKAMSDCYRDFVGAQLPYDELVFENKKMVLSELLPSELHRLAAMLDRIAQRHRSTRDFTAAGLTRALADVIAAFPLYRTYITGTDVSNADRIALQYAVDAAIVRNPTTPRQVFDFISDTVQQRIAGNATTDDRNAVLEVARRFQQLTAPTTAKGIEDTTFYQYQRLISLNEVGYEPGKFGVTADELHGYLADRGHRWPWALSTLSTHDTKRSEDVRARISVLADIPDQWAAAVHQWSSINMPLRRERDGLISPARDEEYCFYQTLLGAWPVECEGATPPSDFVDRVQAFMLKANREANVRTHWTHPDAFHESAVREFVAATLDPERSGAFLDSFLPFQKKVAHFGRLASFSQTVLKLTAPGAADTYQGTEMWDLSLVDPDNRRPVDYARRTHALSSIESPDVFRLFAEAADGRAKLYLHHRLLNLRKRNAGLFTKGSYRALEVKGDAAAHVFAFARADQGKTAIVLITRNLAKRMAFNPQVPIDREFWGDTSIELPAALPNAINVLTDVTRPLLRSVLVADLLDELPVAVWTS